jgi:hypothetical protein
MCSYDEMISSRRPIRHAGSIVHAAGKAVVGLTVDGNQLACATTDCVSVWKLAQDGSGGGDGGSDSVHGPGLLSEVMRYDLSTEGRHTLMLMAFRDGLLLAAGLSKAAKRLREKDGVLSHINPGSCPSPAPSRPPASPPCTCTRLVSGAGVRARALRTVGFCFHPRQLTQNAQTSLLFPSTCLPASAGNTPGVFVLASEIGVHAATGASTLPVGMVDVHAVCHGNVGRLWWPVHRSCRSCCRG